MKIGILGGTGFVGPDILQDIKKIKIHTPYGSPSAKPVIGKLKGIDIVNIPRHGEDHIIPPSHVNYRANIWAMKELGVTHILSVTAVGSLKEDIAPGHLVFPDQFIDRTTRRNSTFFEGQEVCHIPMAEPFCDKLRHLLGKTAERLLIKHHKEGTVITIEGPRFSTRAESRMFRLWGADIINMSTVPEVVLAREAGICYATAAMSTDYDCWHETEEPVTWELIQKTMEENVSNVKRLLIEIIPEIDFVECCCKDAVKTSKL
jgi:5'-methylthioadenosine phosphorylase